MGWHPNVSLWTWRSCERVRLGTDLQKHPLQYQWFLLHLGIWRLQLSNVTLVLLQLRTGRLHCCIALDIFQSHGICSEMRQRGFFKYLRINLPPPCCVRLLDSKWSEDTIHMVMLGLLAENTLTVSVLLTRCQNKNCAWYIEWYRYILFRSGVTPWILHAIVVLHIDVVMAHLVRIHKAVIQLLSHP